MIQIVTDSVASLPADMLEGTLVEVASLFINRDGVEYVDASMDVDSFYADIYDMADNIPISSQPSQSELVGIFERIAKAGDELLGIFVSVDLSGTYNGVIRAVNAVKERFPNFKYSLVDSRSCAFDEAYPILDAVEARREGLSLEECVEAALKGIRSTRFLFTPETLTFLQKGGRIGNAAALLGNLIQLSPVLTVIDGKASSMAKIRSRKKALDKIFQEFKSDVESYGLKNVVVHYIGDKTPAIEWARSAIEPFLGRAVRVVPVSPVIGMHVGPAVGLVYECLKELPYKFPARRPFLVYSS